MRAANQLLPWTLRAAALIRAFLCWVFALAALIFLRVWLSSLGTMLQPSHAATRGGWRWASPAGSLGLLLIAVVFGMAWWTILRRKASARFWGTAASLVNILLGCLELYLSSRYSTRIGWQPLTPLLALGIAGLLVFLPRSLSARLAGTCPVQPSIPGDGTNPMLDKMIGILTIAAFLFGFHWWERWAFTEGFPVHFGLLYYLEIVLASLIVVVVHELGHVIAGKALGMKLRALFIGPFQWRIQEGRWRFQFLPLKIFALGGATGVVPTTLKNFRRNQICMVAAGPLASLAGGLIAVYATLHAPDSRWEPAWMLLALIATLSLLASVMNLIPFRSGVQYSDGAQIYQLLSNGPWGDYHRALSIAGSTLVTPLRPRDYDIEALRRAAACITQGHRGLHLRLLASSHYLDSGRPAEAMQALAEAEAVYHHSALDMPVEWYSEFVFGAAYLNRDAASARAWWQRMQARRPTHFNVDYWLACAALSGVEKRPDDAEEAWQTAHALAQQLPTTGAYQFDRHRVALLRQALDEAAPADVGEALPATTATT